MNTFSIELCKQKRAGVIPSLLAVGGLGAAYALANFWVRKETLLALPLPPMDILLTQVYGMLMVLNLFGIVAAACLSYHMEFQGSAIKKLYMLPVSVPGVFWCKFMILAALLAAAIALEHAALAVIGIRALPQGTFELQTLFLFAVYAFITSLPVIAFMLLTASRFENLWVALGVGVAGFLSGMALATFRTPFLLAHPFVVMLRPAVAMSAQPDPAVAAVSLAESVLFLGTGLWAAKYLRYE